MNVASKQKIITIGLDGGATKIRGAIVHIDEFGQAGDCSQMCEVLYRDTHGFDTTFVPTPLPIQLQQNQSQQIELTSKEIAQGNAIIDSAVLVVQKILEMVTNPPPPLLLGIGMPGLKTPDTLGIAVMANGPRIPEYSQKLSNRLQSAGICLYAPISGLGSDADYCGVGENLSYLGKLRDVETAYYIGIGTGIADAMKIMGNLVTFDSAKPWIGKSWEILAAPGLNMEKMVAMPGIWQTYQSKCPELNNKDGHAGILWEHGKEGYPTALKLLAEIAQNLAYLIYDRMYTLAVGGTTLNFANPTRILSLQHPYLGMVWQKIVLGQRMGHIWQNEEYRPFFQHIVVEEIKQLIQNLPTPIAEYYLKNIELTLVASPMDQAPVLGSAITAYRKNVFNHSSK